MDDSTPEAEALYDAMQRHSAEWHAGWLTDSEFYLWSAVVGDGRWPEIGPDARRRAPLLRSLSAAAGGWWTYEGFLPLER